MSYPDVTVSAVIPTRDRPVLLRRAIEGVLGQAGDALAEVIVVFDQSEPDTTLERLSTDIPIRVITNTRKPGLAGARNTGIEAATGTWVAFCDDDDAWCPDKLQQQVKTLARNTDADFVVGGITIAYGERRIDRRTTLRQLTFRDLLRSRVMEAHPSTFLVRRSAILDAIGLVDEDLAGSYAEDYDWLLRAAKLRPVIVAEGATTVVRWHQSSYFGNRWEMIDEALAHLVAKTPEFADEPRGLARILGQRAFAQAAMGRGGQAMHTAGRALKLDWRQLRVYVTPVVAMRLIRADRLVRWANAVGRGF